MTANGTIYKLDPDQVLRAATALLKAVERSKKEIDSSKSPKKRSLFDADGVPSGAKETPVWLVFTAKQHIIDKHRLKPGKIKIPHPLLVKPDSRICLITADPPKDRPKAYKDLIASPAFPNELKSKIVKAIAMSRLKAKFKSFESRRKLLAEYDIFLADERIITGLPMVLGKTFFKSTSKRPIPVCLTGKLKFGGQGRPDKTKLLVKKRRDQQEGGSANVGAPADVAEEIERTLKTTLVHLAPSTTTSVKAGVAEWKPEQVSENVEAIVEAVVDKYIPKKWRGVKSIHVKTPDSAALPIWLADELWVDEEQVLNTDETPKLEKSKKREKRTRKALEGSDDEVETSSKKRKSDDTPKDIGESLSPGMKSKKPRAGKSEVKA